MPVYAEARVEHQKLNGRVGRGDLKPSEEHVFVRKIDHYFQVIRFENQKVHQKKPALYVN